MSFDKKWNKVLECWACAECEMISGHLPSCMTGQGTPRATELEWLKWFFINCDFGPADSDVRDYLSKQFMQETGKSMPQGYEDES